MNPYLSIDFGSTVSWVSVMEALGTVLAIFAALGVAAYEAHRAREERRERRAAEKREQALLVHVWMESRLDTDNGNYYGTLRYHNASAYPVWNLFVNYVRDDPEIGEVTEHLFVPFVPSGQPQSVEIGPTIAYIDASTPLSCQFRDSRNVSWQKDPRGALEIISEGGSSQAGEGARAGSRKVTHPANPAQRVIASIVYSWRKAGEEGRKY